MKQTDKNKILTSAWIKLFVLCIGIILLFWGFSRINLKKEKTVSVETPQVESTFNQLTESELKTKLKSVTFTVPDTQVVVQLKNGDASYKIDPELDAMGDVSLGDPQAIYEITKTSTRARRTDIISPVTVESGGSGVFAYIELFSWTGEKLLERSYAFLGDRIAITKVSTTIGLGKEEYRVVVEYLVRSDTEAMSDEPTHPRRTTIPVFDGHFDSENAKTISL